MSASQADESGGHYWRFVQGLTTLGSEPSAPAECWRFTIREAAPLVLPPVAKVGRSNGA